MYKYRLVIIDNGLQSRFSSSWREDKLFDSGERSGDVGEVHDVERSGTATSVVEGVGAFSFSLYLFTSQTSSEQADPPYRIGP